MKKIMGSAKKKSLTMLGALAMVVGVASSSVATWWICSQPECPNELLK